MSDCRHFDAPWSITLKLVTFLTSALLVGITISGLVKAGMPPLVRLQVAILPLLLMVLCAVFLIRGYEIAPDAILVERLGWTTRIPLAGLRSVVMDPKATRRSFRSCGNGGFFSFTGWYWNKALGRYRLFGTDLANTVVLDFGKRRVVLTPEEPEVFVRKLKEVTGLV